MNGVAATQPTITTTIEAAKIQKPIQEPLSRAAYMWLRLRSAPVVSQGDVHDDEDQEPEEHQEVQRPGGLDAEDRADP